MFRQYRTNEVVQMWMNFARGATAKIEDLTSGKSRFLQAADCVKFAADAAAELCGIALTDAPQIFRSG